MQRSGGRGAIRLKFQNCSAVIAEIRWERKTNSGREPENCRAIIGFWLEGAEVLLAGDPGRLPVRCAKALGARTTRDFQPQWL